MIKMVHRGDIRRWNHHPYRCFVVTDVFSSFAMRTGRMPRECCTVIYDNLHYEIVPAMQVELESTVVV